MFKLLEYLKTFLHGKELPIIYPVKDSINHVPPLKSYIRERVFNVRLLEDKDSLKIIKKFIYFLIIMNGDKVSDKVSVKVSKTGVNDNVIKFMYDNPDMFMKEKSAN